MALAKFVEAVISRLKETPVDFALIGEDGAQGSILNGASGAALFLYEVARLRGDDGALALARRWCEVTRAWAAGTAPSQWNGTPHGFMVGEGGLVFVEALLAAATTAAPGERDHDGVIRAVEGIDRIATRVGEITSNSLRSTEYAGGAAGILTLTRELDARLPSGPGYAAARAVLARARARALELVLARYEKPLAPGPRDHLGFAHGIAGELWALVRTLGADHPIVRARLAELAALRETDEEGLVYWVPWSGCNEIELIGSWCNGMAGHTLLWCEVARQTRSEESMGLARSCAESVGVLVAGGPSLCCGNAGHALALQRYAELSGDAKVGRQAYARLVSAVRMQEAAEREGSRRVALWQGGLGVALAAMERLAGERGIACLERGSG